MTKKLFSLFFFAILMFVSKAQTLDSLPQNVQETPKYYEIGGTKVTGVQFADANALINIAGLTVGKKIKIPSSDIQNAMKALWKLRLFDDVQIVKDRVVGDVVFLEIKIKERPVLTTFSYIGAKKNEQDALNAVVTRFIPKNTILTESNKANAVEGLTKYFTEKGYLDAVVSTKETPDANKPNGVKMVFTIQKNRRVKIENICFEGNNHASEHTLRKLMAHTTRKMKLFATSKMIPAEYEEDKKRILKHYQTLGFRDAKIVQDTISRTPKGDLLVQLKLDEGQRYYFRNITWRGNTIHPTEKLSTVLNIQKGDVYNTELLEQRLRFGQNGEDVSSLYMDDGYLFFTIDPIETAISGDSIDLEMRIFEGRQAIVDKIIIKGNDRTHEHVIRRELHTEPGQKFNRADIIRSQREIINLGYFNQEALGVTTPVNPQRGTVDVEYKVAEKSSDQFEMSAGWGGSGVVGSVGMTFNNFSFRNILNKTAWMPMPQGDGQRLSLRAQSDGKHYRSYNISLTEPWLGGKRANSLTVGSSYTQYSSYDANSRTAGIFQASASLGRRLKFPDNYFLSTTTIEYQRFNMNGYSELFGNLPQGVYNNFNISETISRNTLDNNVFTKHGSRISLILSATPPYSLFNGKRYADLGEADKFKWIEYYKWRVNAEHFTPLSKKVVLRTAAKIGSLGQYNSAVGYPPFNRFVLGGDGVSGRQAGQIGQEVLALRGYSRDDFPNSGNGGATTFAKYTAELRYLILPNPSATVYATTWLEAGNTWNGIKNFNPFDVKRSAGVGLRAHLPMFGTLGFDYGWGFDKLNVVPNKWSGYGSFNFILGFEPD
jgi:outer membrane protein insertion porin family